MNHLKDTLAEFTNRSLKILLICYKEVETVPNKDENDLILIAMVGLKDHPKKRVSEAVNQCK